jgi:glycosyltransferase involved in cell wall biosynthesis
MRILFLSRWFPYPPSNGSKIRIYNLVRGLASQHEVGLISFVDGSEKGSDISEFSRSCCQIKTVPLKSFNPNSRLARLGFLSSTPRWAVDTFSEEMKVSILQALSSGGYDAVIASQVDMAVYARYFNGIPALFEEVEVGVLYEAFAHAPAPWKRFRSGLTWAKHRRYLARLLSCFHACTVVSDREKELLSKAVPGFDNVHVIPNCVRLEDYTGIEAEKAAKTLIFTGALSYGPNYDAVLWFLQEIFPLVQAETPDVRLLVTGDPGGRVLPPARNVELTGYVQEIAPLVASSSISLAPIRHGGGTRLKILESMALRTPVVSTSKGAEGLDVRHNENILLADTREAFAEAVVCLLKDPDEARRIAENGRKLVRKAYDWDRRMPDFLNIIEQIVTISPHHR